MLDRSRHAWNVLHQFHTENKERQETIENVLNKNQQEFRLDYKDLVVNLPQLHSEHLQAELDNLSVFQQDKLSLSSLIKAWGIITRGLPTNIETRKNSNK